MTQLDARQYINTVQQILVGIHNVAEGAGETWISAVDVSKHLREVYRVDIHWRTIDAVLSNNRSLVTRRKRKSRWEYMILDAGRTAIACDNETISFVDPSNALQATLKLHDVLAGLAGTIRICDPYLDESTIEHLQACPKNQSLRLLTMNVKDTGPLRRLIAAAKVASYLIEVRVVRSRSLHDRYIIDDAAMLILGTSLNGFGKKQSFVINAGPDIRQMVLSQFDTHWAVATTWS